MSNLTKIIGTGKSKHMPKGEAYYEIPEMAELLVSKGVAVYEGELVEEKEKVEAAPESKKEIKKPTSKKNK